MQEGVSCIKISFCGKDAPYFAYGRAYVRVADEDRQLSAKELENLILTKNRDLFRWENEISQATLDDLDENKLKRFVERAGLAWDTPAGESMPFHRGKPSVLARLHSPRLPATPFREINNP